MNGLRFVVDYGLHGSLRSNNFNGLHENISTDRDAHEKPDHENEVSWTHDPGWHQGSSWDVNER